MFELEFAMQRLVVVAVVVRAAEVLLAAAWSLELDSVVAVVAVVVVVVAAVGNPDQKLQPHSQLQESPVRNLARRKSFRRPAPQPMGAFVACIVVVAVVVV